jgi:threonine/homoserine/homoserine lactone efflux protein
MPTLLSHVLAFAGAALLLAIAPGPATAVLLRQTIRHGRRRAVATIAGIEAGVLFWGITAAVGLTALLAASRISYDVLRIGGALVLIGLGTQALVRARRTRDTGALAGLADPVGAHPDPQADLQAAAAPDPDGDAHAARRAFGTGLVTNLANPKAGVFAISFLPQFIPRGAPVLPTGLLLAVVWVACDCTWYFTLTATVHAARRWFSRTVVRRRLETLTGVALIGFGVRLATEQR